MTATSGVPPLTWHTDDHFTVEGVRFTCGFDRGGSADHLPIWKPRPLIEAYVRAVESLWPTNIVELGIAAGGSAALLRLLARPDRLLALDLSPDRVPALDAFLDRYDDGSVALRYGVDQGDREALARTVDDAAFTSPLDLVIDDASHLLGPSRTSFEVLFPRLRPGGRYVIEDWNWEHLGADRISAALGDRRPDPADVPIAARTPIGRRLDEPAVRSLSDAAAGSVPLDGPFASLMTGEVLSLIAVELLLARARSGDAVASVEIDGYWIVVTRGPGDLEPGSFRLSQLYDDHFGLLRSTDDEGPAVR